MYYHMHEAALPPGIRNIAIAMQIEPAFHLLAQQVIKNTIPRNATNVECRVTNVVVNFVRILCHCIIITNPSAKNPKKQQHLQQKYKCNILHVHSCPLYAGSVGMHGGELSVFKHQMCYSLSCRYTRYIQITHL